MKTKKNTTLWKSLIQFICFTLLITYIPIGNFSEVFAEEKNDAAVADHSSQPQARKEIESKRTAHSKTFLNPDGTYTSEISQSPIHYKNSGDSWSTIDSHLIENPAEEVYQNKANAFKAKLDKKIDQAAPVLHVVDEDKSIKLTLAPLDTTGEKPAEVTGIVKENSIHYPEIYHNTSFTYTVGADRIKEDIVFDERPVSGFPDKFTYKMDLEGLYAKEEDGILYLHDKDTNQPIYYFETPYMYDSYKPEGFQTAKEITSVPEEAISYDVKLEHEIIDGQLYLYLVPNKAWLEDPARIYPITIDPTIVKLQSSNYVKDTNLRSSFPAQTGGNDLELGGGAANGNVIRSLLKFDLSSIPGATHILSSSLNLWFSSTNGSSPVDLGLFKVSRGWEENQASWNYAMTSPSVAWTNKGGDYVTSNKLATVIGLTSPTNLDADRKKWEVPVHIIQNWKDGSDPNYGFMLKSDSESTNIYKKFVSSEHTFDSKYHPLLTVTYRTNARLGLEDYWLYDSHPLVGGMSYSNLTTDNNVIQYTDFSLKGKGGFGLDFTRTYNSKSQESSVFGYGWTFTGNEKLFLNIKGTANILDYQEADGTDQEFTYDVATATYYSGPGKYLRIKKSATDSTIYIMEDKYGVKTTFKILQMNKDTNVQVANIITQEDLHGNQIRYAYDSANNNRIKSISTADIDNVVLNTITFQYDPTDGYIQSASYGGSTFTFTIDDATGYVQAVDQLKDTVSTRTSFAYTNGVLSRITDPNNRKTDYTYQNGYLQKVQDPQLIDGVLDPVDRPGITYSIDPMNKMATVTQPEGTVTTYYTNDNYVPTKIVEDGIETIFTRDANYNPLKVTENGVTTTNEYDANGNLLSTTDKYDANGNVISTTENPEHTTKYTYTTYSNVATMEDSNHNVTRYTYKSNGDMDTVYLPDGGTVKYVFDKFGDLDTVTHPDEKSIDYFDFNYSSGLTTIEKTDAFGNKTKTVTDRNENVLENVDGKLNKYTFQYNKKNELEKVTDPYLKDTDYQYDANGNLLSITNANRKTTSFEYDGQNRLIKEIDPLHQSDQKGITYQYDHNGNLIETNLLNGHSIRSQYDYSSDQVTNISVNTGSENMLMWAFAYDQNDRLSMVCEETPCDSEAKAEKVFAYNTDDSLQSISDRGNLIEYKDQGTTQLTHYKAGNQEATLEYVLNNMNLVQSIKRTGAINPFVTFDYEKGGLPKSVAYQSGGSMQYTYVNNRLDTFGIYNKANTMYDTYRFEYDPNQNMTKITSNAGTTNYQFDSLNQITQEILPDGTTITYDYDDVGNRIGKIKSKTGVTLSSKTSVYNDLNQLVEIKENNQTVESFSYDLNGNLSSDINKTYEFNDFNELAKIIDKNSGQTISYTYDEEGKRISSHDSSNGETIHYFYDGDQVLFETDANNNVVREYTYNEQGIPLTMTIGQDTYYYLFNHHGDIMGLTDSTGNVVASYTYDAWGNILSQTGPMASVNPYRYAGYRYDENTKLYYLMARYYNPENGVFLSIDPVRGELSNPVTQNGYNYANNNPVMLVDPHGSIAIPIVYAAVLAVLGTAMVWYAIQALDAVGTIIDQSFAKVRTRPNYKSNYEVHHIVAQTAKKAKSARDVLSKVGLNVNSSSNLVSIKTGLHRRLHTNQYYETVNSIMNKAYSNKYSYNTNRNRVLAALGAIKVWLKLRSSASPF